MIEIIDGFDTNIESDLNWNSGSGYNRTSGRFGGSAAIGIYPSTQGTYLQKTFAALGTRICGFAFIINGYFGWTIVQFMDNNVTQLILSVTTTGQFQVLSGSNILATTAPYIFRTNAWYYIEFSVTIHNTLGAFELRLGETTILAGSNLNTRQSVNSSSNVIQFNIINSIFGQQVTVDDLYVLNTTGTKNNSFLGEQKVITSDVNSDNSIQFSRNSGTSNYGQLLTDDGDATYTNTNVIGNKDLFGIVPLSLTPNNYSEFYNGNDITCIRAVVVARKDDTGYRNIGIDVFSGVTESIFPFSVSSAGFPSFDIPLISTYESSTAILENDPNTNTSWTKNGVNNVLVGYELIG